MAKTSDSQSEVVGSNPTGPTREEKEVFLLLRGWRRSGSGFWIPPGSSTGEFKYLENAYKAEVGILTGKNIVYTGPEDELFEAARGRESG